MSDPLQQTAAPAASALVAGWRQNLAVFSLRGNAGDPDFAAAARRALGLELPVQPCTTASIPQLRAVWAGPDDWLLLAKAERADALAAGLRAELAGQHHALTDISSGCAIARLGGGPVREVLAAGCPLDLHPRAFGIGASAGSHFFKAPIRLWRAEVGPAFELELLLRRRFQSYFWLMLERCTRECGLMVRSFP